MVFTATRHNKTSGNAKNKEREEGLLARVIESQTSKLPSDLFLWAAFASMGVSFALQVARKKEESLFIGQWAPSFLLLGVYNKMVKLMGSDRD